MARPTTGRATLFGPYAHGAGYRLIEKVGRQRTAAYGYPTKEAADRAKPILQAALDGRPPESLEGVVEQYKVHLEASGQGRDSVAVTLRAIRGVLGGDRAMSSLTPTSCKALYAKYTQKVTRFGTTIHPATHRSELQRTKQFLDWCVEAGHLRQNPAADVKPIGRVAKGKPQHTRDQAQKFLTKALEAARDPDLFTAQRGIACALSLVLGSRASEAMTRHVQDVDAGGTVLIIPKGKTENAKRELEIPDFLRHHLRRLTEGRKGGEWLFLAPTSGRGSGGQPTHRSRQWLWTVVREMCAAADVPVVPPHGLRGTFSTIGLQASTVPHLVAAALGHGSEAITMEHYADKEQVAAEQRRRTWKVLQGGV